MNKIFKILILFFIFIFILFQYYIFAYSTDKYEIALPSSFEKIADNVFTNKNGVILNIQINEGKTTLDSSFYSKESLDKLSNEYSNKFSNSEYVKEIVSTINENYNLKMNETDIKKVLDSVKFDFKQKEIITLSSNKYKCFHFGIECSVNSYNVYMNQYMVFEKNNIFVLTITSQNSKYFDSTEFKNIMDSFSIKNFEEPTSNHLFSEKYTSRVIATTIMVVICSIVGFIKKSSSKKILEVEKNENIKDINVSKSENKENVIQQEKEIIPNETNKKLSKKEKDKLLIDYLLDTEKKLKISLVIVSIITVSISIFAVYKINQVKKINNSSSKTEELVSILKSNNKNLESENLSLKKQNNEYKEKIDFFDKNIVFVIDGYGKYYYTYDQMEKVTQGLDEYSYWAYNKEQAKDLGYKAWKNKK